MGSSTSELGLTSTIVDEVVEGSKWRLKNYEISLHLVCVFSP